MAHDASGKAMTCRPVGPHKVTCDLCLWRATGGTTKRRVPTAARLFFYLVGFILTLVYLSTICRPARGACHVRARLSRARLNDGHAWSVRHR
jgi:hypothetical protein